MVQETARDISMTDIRQSVVRHMQAVFGTTLTMTDETVLKALMDFSAHPHAMKR
jgi:hypothetical protein